MSKKANQTQSQYEACQMAVDREESYAMFVEEDWRAPFVEYLASGVLV